MQPPKWITTLLLVTALALAPGASSVSTDATTGLAHATAAQAIADAVRDADGDAARLQEVAQLIAAIHVGLTPEQAEVLARGGPVTPNHPGLVDEIGAIRADASLDAVAQGHRIARAATEAQARALGVDLVAPRLAGHALPSDALVALAASASVALSDEDLAEARGLDALSPGAAAALARVIDAYVAMNDAATLAIQASPDAPDWGATLGARLVLLETVDALRDALLPEDLSRPVAASSWTLYNIDLTPTNNFYTTNYAFSLDADGNDWYQNNGGGNWLGNCDMPTTASAFVDLGGSDTYAPAYDHNPGGTPNIYPDHCGKSGGANRGVGFLLDHGGTNQFSAGQGTGVNGGANDPASLGSLFSFGGANDRFHAGCYGTNGGGNNGGVGLLVATGSGSTDVNGGCQGSNGGGNNGGLGLLVDAVGGWHDADGEGTNGGAQGLGSAGFAYGDGTWNADWNGVNGGGSGGGTGTLVATVASLGAGGFGANGGASGSGSGGYAQFSGSATAWGGNGANGGGSQGGRGTLLAGYCWCSGGSNGVNGGGYESGTGFLAATEGDFSAGSHGTNGGGDELGVGYLLVGSLGGRGYDASGIGTNGGGANSGIGNLVDSGLASATYDAGSQGVNGGAYAAGRGLLIDAEGSDRYIAGSQGANGGAMATGTGILIELTGNDVYQCASPACNGAVVGSGGVGVLVDVQGADTYNGNGAWPSFAIPNGVGGFRFDASPV